MIEAPRPEDEKQRLESLARLHLLDTPIEERFERITRLVCRFLNVPIAAFTLIDERRQWYKSIQGSSAIESSRQLSVCAHTILSEEILMIPDARQDERFFDHPLVTGDTKIIFYASCPVRAPDGKKVGTLCAMDTRPRELGAEHAQILRDLALLVETELRVAMLSKVQAELIAELDAAHRQALIDPLTRLWNRGGIMELLKREWKASIRSKKPIAVVMADIDHFKKINDTHGHPVGDAVLQAVSRKLLTALRAEDIIGRVGGEEFLIILPACSIEKLQQIVERIRLSVTRSPVATMAGKLEITLSFGAVAALPYSSLTTEQVIAAADKALYAAKKSRRNCVKLAPPLVAADESSRMAGK